MVIDEEYNTINYFLPGPDQENDKRASAEIIQQILREFKDVFNGIGCFDGNFHYSLNQAVSNTRHL